MISDWIGLNSVQLPLQIDNVPGKITLLKKFKDYYAEICLVYFFAEYYGFAETETFFSESLIFALSNEV